MELETKLEIAYASINALKEEIAGLHLCINKLRNELGLPVIFSVSQGHRAKGGDANGFGSDEFIIKPRYPLHRGLV